MKEQIALYKKWRKVLQQGTFTGAEAFTMEHRVEWAAAFLADEAGNQMEWTCVSEDGTKAVGMLMQKLVVPNHAAADLLSEGIAVGCPLPFLQPEIKNIISKNSVIW